MKTNIDEGDEEYISTSYIKKKLITEQDCKNSNFDREDRKKITHDYKEEPESDEESFEDNSYMLELFEEKDMGIGVRAVIIIPAKCTLGEYKGDFLSQHEAITKMCNNDLHYIIGTDLPDRYIDGENSEDNKILKYINHKCDNSNCELVKLTKGRVGIQTKRQIQVHEELHYNYQMIYFEDYLPMRIKCQCTDECKNFF